MRCILMFAPFRTTISVLLCVLCVSCCSLLFASKSAFAIGSDDASISIPEVIIYDKSAKYCVVHVGVNNEYSNVRKVKIINFIEKSYIYTEKWAANYIVSAVDYADFTGFYVVTFDNCDGSHEVIAKISDGLKSCEKPEAEGCSEIGVKITEESHSLLVQPIQAHERTQAIFLFDLYREFSGSRKMHNKTPH